ncbi:hypothetical protein NL676_035927 [Syzygium grande]|nr:hypothetical protein NL676_035927 [Syzygium grande]
MVVAESGKPRFPCDLGVLVAAEIRSSNEKAESFNRREGEGSSRPSVQRYARGSVTLPSEEPRKTLTSETGQQLHLGILRQMPQFLPTIPSKRPTFDPCVIPDWSFQSHPDRLLRSSISMS